MSLTDWARKWGINAEAFCELIAVLENKKTADTLKETPHFHERDIQNKVRLEASKKGCRLWRNNVGAAKTETGNFIRFGLANESAAINKKIKSADLIGIRPVIITQAHIGKTIGQFLSREIKKPNWKYSANEREIAQLNWINLISSLGGDAAFTTNIGSI